MSAETWLEAYDVETGMATLPAFLMHVDHALRRLARSPLTLAVLSTRADELLPRRPGRWTNVERALLVETARRLGAVIRPGDVAARIGEVDFAVLCEDLTSYDHAVGVAVRMLDELDRPLLVDGTAVQMDLRFGVTFPLAEEHEAQPILDRSLEAMRAARMNPESRYDVILGSATPDADLGGVR